MSRHLISVTLNDVNDVDDVSVLRFDGEEMCTGYDLFTDGEGEAIRKLLVDHTDLDSVLWGSIYVKMFGRIPSKESEELRAVLNIRHPYFSYEVVKTEAVNDKVRLHYRTKVTLPEGFKYTITGDGQYMIYHTTFEINSNRYVSSLYSPTHVRGVMSTEVLIVDIDADKVVSHLMDVQGQYNQFNNNVGIDLMKMTAEIESVTVERNTSFQKAMNVSDLINSLIEEAPNE